MNKRPSKRFDRQLQLAGMTADAQKKLAQSHVTLLGLGGLGCACAAYLADAGIGSLMLIDPHKVTLPDLNEQILYTPEDVGKLKVEIAKARLLAMNPDIEVSVRNEAFDPHNAEKLLHDADIVVDALDDWQEKLLASDVCLQFGKTLVHGGVRAFELQIYTMIPGKSACLRCVFSKVGLEDVARAGNSPGVLGPVAGMAGSFQAIEVIKLLSGIGPTPGSHLIKFDSLRRDFDDVTDLNPRPDCPDCGRRYS